MENAVIENHQQYLERRALYREYGYDIYEERAFIIEKACPISGKILEAGTGKGHFTLALALEGFHFTSFDVSEAEQKYARLNLKYYGLEQQVQFQIANAESLCYEDDCFDVIFAVNMVHHLSSVPRFCDEIVRVLAHSEKLVLSDFNAHGLDQIDKIHALEGRRHEVGEATLNEIEQLLIKRDFKTQWYRNNCQDTLIACRRNA
jgi:SAM-dependent methyltransferase